MMTIIWILVTFGLSTGIVMTAFLMYPTSKKLLKAEKEGRIKMRPAMKVTMLIWYLVGAPADVVYNIIVGTIRFGVTGGLRKTYSKRVQAIVDLKDRSSNTDRKEALRDALVLNEADEGHVDL